MINRSLRHYRIQAKLGEGGMGVVYRALDTHLDRPVAIKVLSERAVASPERRKRFVQEAKAASALNHPNIVTIYDIDTFDGIDFIAMEFVPGKTLDAVIAHHPLALREVMKYAIQIADALSRAHGVGIYHRDLKPANIMATPEGLIKILDFGLAKLTEVGGADALTATQKTHLTEEGSILGTPAYMSPEQAEGKEIDGRSDIFSFGSILYEMVTGRRAFTGETKMSTLSAVLRAEPRPVAERVPGLPHEIERIISRCLKKDRERRFQQMAEVKLDLEELKEESESGKSVPAAAPPTQRLRAIYGSERDGARCIWAQRLDPATKHPAGPAFPVAHFHDARISLQLLTNSGDAGPAVGAGKLVFVLGERTGNIWMTRVK